MNMNKLSFFLKIEIIHDLQNSVTAPADNTPIKMIIYNVTRCEENRNYMSQKKCM